jgi:hypothetical protein
VAADGSKLIQVGVAAVVVLATTITLLGVNGEVQTLQGRVRDLEVATATLDQIETRIDRLQANAVELGHFRNDILAAVCVANARTPGDLRRCRRRAG